MNGITYLVERKLFQHQEEVKRSISAGPATWKLRGHGSLILQHLADKAFVCTSARHPETKGELKIIRVLERLVRCLC